MIILASVLAVSAGLSQLRLEGKLDEAQREVRTALQQIDLTPVDAVALHLELAKIHDRVGLHTNTRPVAAALREVEVAESLAAGLGPASRGAVAAGKAAYYYRAETPGTGFPQAQEHVRRAIELLEEAGATRDQADAVHLQGLIELQLRNLERARELFDESLELDSLAGPRAWMQGEYHRHVAFVHVFEGDWAAALPHFERSLRAREEAGAIDASLFAAISLGTAHLRTGNAKAAPEYFHYALEVARAIPSPAGVARASLVLGEAREELEHPTHARVAYKDALEAAQAMGYDSIAKRASEALERLQGAD